MSGSTSGNTTSFSYTGQFVTYAVRATGLYDITAYGAQGGDTGNPGGLGAEIGGDVQLTAGETLKIAVGGSGGGGSGGGAAAGGGGGSFVVLQGGTPQPLVIAGGGGGGANQNGLPGLTGPAGGAGGGTGGNGGQSGGAYAGGGGGGFRGNGGNASAGPYGPGGGGGASYANGLGGGSVGITGGGIGGFGGGAGAYSGGGGGGGYSGGGGGNNSGAGGGGGGSLAGGTNQLLVSGENSGNGLVTITQLFASTIAVSGSGQTTATGSTPATPFTGVTISDPNGANPANPSGPTEMVTVTPSSTTGGTLSDSAGGSVNGSTGVYTVSGTATQVNTDLAALTFTPAAGQSGKTIFTIADTNWAGLASNTGTTSVVVSSLTQPSVITVPAADQNQTSTGLTPVTSFAGVSITDANTGSPTETVTITPSSTTSGILSDSNAASDGSKTSNGTITLTGSASSVTSEIDALKFTPAFGQFGKTSFTIADTNSAGQTTTPPGTTSVTVNPPPPPTTAQLKQIGTDILQFYKDTVSHQSTAADTTKLVNDFTATDVSQAQLGQLLGQTLTSAMLSSSAAATLGTDIAGIYYPKISTDLSHAGAGLANDLSAMVVTTAAAGADDLLRVHNGQSASQALAGTLQDFKLG